MSQEDQQTIQKLLSCTNKELNAILAETNRKGLKTKPRSAKLEALGITGIPKREHKKRSPDAPKKVATGYVKFRQEELAKAKLAGSPLKDAVVRGMWKKVVEEKATSSPASEEPVSA